MIARFWHGKTKTSEAAAYRKYVTDTGIRDLTSTSGNLGAQIWQQEEGELTHIIVLSWWTSYESIKLFAGNDFSIARYYDEDKRYLIELEPHVQHYECYDFPENISNN